MRREYQILDRAFDPMVMRAKTRQDLAPHRGDGDRRGKGPRRQEHPGTVPVITGLDHVVVLVGDIAAGDGGLSDAVCADAGVAQQRRRRRPRAVHARQHDAGVDGARRRRRHCGPDSRRARGAGRGAGEPLFPHQRHRQNASQARPADAEAGAGRGSRKPRCCHRRDLVVEADPRRDRRHARHPAVLPRTGQGAPAVGANRARIDHRDGPCRGLDRRSRTRRGALWRAARARHGARPLASRLGPADVLPLRRSDRRGHAPAGQATADARRTTGCGA